MKHWKITGRKGDWVIFWGYSDTVGNKFPYFIGSSKTPRSWKTLEGATKFGLKHFGFPSSN